MIYRKQKASYDMRDMIAQPAEYDFFYVVLQGNQRKKKRNSKEETGWPLLSALNI